jgi:hypothetical protein
MSKAGWQIQDNGGETYQSTKCIACNAMHLVNPETGKVLTGDGEQ